MVVGRDEVADLVARWADGIERAHERIAGRFRRPEPRRRALAYLRGLLSSVERKNGWQLAEQAGDATPDGVQRLLSTTTGGTRLYLVRDDLGDYVVEHLGCADGVVVVDETGFLKKGDKSAGVQRQYSGTAGRIENCQVGVFLAYAGVKGRTLLDRELYLPQVWARDWERRREAGVPDSVGFRTKPQLAQFMLGRTLESGVPFAWFTGDEVYGSGRNLRLWLEREEIAHVMAIKSNEKLVGFDRPGTAAGEGGPPGWRLGLRNPPGYGAAPEWRQGTPGLRLGCGGYSPPERTGQRPLAAGPAQRRQAWRVGLLRLLRSGGHHSGGTGEGGRNQVGHRGMLRGGQVPGEVGLDQYEVRRWDGWYRHITLAMLAQAYLAVIRHQAMEQGEKGAATVRMKS